MQKSLYHIDGVSGNRSPYSLSGREESPNTPPHHFVHYVYILKSKKDSKLYIGVTNDLERRLQEHKNGHSKSTKHRRPLRLVYYEAFRSKADAHERERKLKQFKNSYKHLKNRIKRSIEGDNA